MCPSVLGMSIFLTKQCIKLLKPKNISLVLYFRLFLSLSSLTHTRTYANHVEIYCIHLTQQPHLSYFIYTIHYSILRHRFSKLDFHINVKWNRYPIVLRLKNAFHYKKTVCLGYMYDNKMVINYEMINIVDLTMWKDKENLWPQFSR